MADASLYSDPASMPGCPVDGEDQSLLSGSAFCPHSHHPSTHDHDWQGLLCHGDEMCKYLSLYLQTHFILLCVCFSAVTGRVCVAAGRR